MKKIAVCLNGEPRSILQCSKYIKKYFDELNVDYFCQAWDNNTVIHPKNLKLNNLDIQEKKLYNNISQLKEYVQTIYNPKNILIEKFDQERVLGQYMAAEKVIKLKQEYEKKHNFKYDIVIRCRYDIAIENVCHNTKINFFNNYDDDFIHINNIRTDIVHNALYASISDHGPWIGSSKTMDVYHKDISKIVHEWYKSWLSKRTDIKDRKRFVDILFPQTTLTPEAKWALLFGVKGIRPVKYKQNIFIHNILRSGTPLDATINDVKGYHVYRDIIRVCEEKNIFNEKRSLLKEEEFKQKKSPDCYHDLLNKVTNSNDKDISLIIQ